MHFNESRLIVGYYYDGSGSAHGYVRAAEGTITTFDPPKSTLTYANGINKKGEIVGLYIDGTGAEHAYLRRPSGKMISFDVPGGLSTAGEKINADGAYHGG